MTTKLPPGDLKSILYWRFGDVVGYPFCAKMVAIAKEWDIDLLIVVESVPVSDDIHHPTAMVYGRLLHQVERVKATNLWMVETAAREQAERLRGY